jgi:hypothetical protein
MVNAWVSFVKKWASDNNMSYGCALSKPECSQSYRATRPPKLSKKETAETERMGAEDVSATARRELARQESARQTAEMSGMMGEDRNVAQKKTVPSKTVPSNYKNIMAKELRNIFGKNPALAKDLAGVLGNKPAPKKSAPKKSAPKKSEPKKDKRGIPFANMMQVEEREKMSLAEYETKYAKGYKVFKDIYGNIVTYEPNGKLIGDTRVVIFPEYNSPSDADEPYQINFRRGIDDNEFPVKYAKQYKEYYDAKRNGFSKANIDVRTEEGRKQLSQLEDRITRTMLVK